MITVANMSTKRSGLKVLARLLGRLAARDYLAELRASDRPAVPPGGWLERRLRGWLVHWPPRRGQRIARVQFVEAPPPSNDRRDTAKPAS